MHKNSRPIIFLFLLAIVLSTCSTTGRPANTSEIEHSRYIGNLETRVSELTERLELYDRAIARSLDRLETVRDEASSIGNNIDKLAKLISEYDSIVDELLRTAYKEGTAAQDS